jgi:nitroimidazol reductase NimA-like FMN-containing flavoprotein (pyridoxamine 5'-phosphate oxidase superfamily)
MDPAEITRILNLPISEQLLASAIPARVAYSALDGSPRVIPIAFHWDGSNIVVCTLPNSAKVPALEADPRVAITIDTEHFPPHVLLVRGTAHIETVEGLPDEYLAASRKMVPDDQWDGWETGVRALYDRMVRITVEPTWVKLLDFETTIPSAVQELVDQHQQP